MGKNTCRKKNRIVLPELESSKFLPFLTSVTGAPQPITERAQARARKRLAGRTVVHDHFIYFMTIFLSMEGGGEDPPLFFISTTFNALSCIYALFIYNLLGVNIEPFIL